MSVGGVGAYQRIAQCDAADAPHVEACLRAHSMVDPSSVVSVPESYRVHYRLDELSISHAEIACADLAVLRELDRVRAEHRFPLG